MKISSWVDFHLSNTQAWVRNSTPPLLQLECCQTSLKIRPAILNDIMGSLKLKNNPGNQRNIEYNIPNFVVSSLYLLTVLKYPQVLWWPCQTVLYLNKLGISSLLFWCNFKFSLLDTCIHLQLYIWELHMKSYNALTHLPLNKMVAISQFRMHFHEWKIV